MKYLKYNKYKNYFLKIMFNIIIFIQFINFKNKKKVGVIGLGHGYNIGNNLLKYAISKKLSEFGFIPYIIGTNSNNKGLTFIKYNTNCRIVKNFSEIKKKDYDILMVNSDQTWRKFDKHFYDIGFLKFAKNWNIPKFVYGASLGFSDWKLTKKEEIIIKDLIKNFTDISTREKSSVKIIKSHLGIEPKFVLDPTLLIDKKYYLNIIKYYKEKLINDKYIFIYLFKMPNNIREVINNATKLFGYKIYNVDMNEENSVQKFIYGIIHCKAVITNSFHGTVFSILFNKPFITFIFKNSPKERLLSLKSVFKLNNRIIFYNQRPNISLLNTSLNINYTILKLLKIQSINYLKKNLGIL